MKKMISVVAALFAFCFCNAQWEPDVRLTNNNAISKASSANTWGIAYSGDTVHVTWFDSRNGNFEIYYKRSIDCGVNWGPDTRLTFNSAASEWPGIAVNGQDLHVCWEDSRDGVREIYYKRSIDGGQTWGDDVRISFGNYNAFLAAVATNGTAVHITWQDERVGNDEVYYRRSSDGGTTWEPEVRLSNNQDYSGLPSVAVSGSVVHIAWEETRDGNADIYYRRSADGGLNWGPETRLTTSILESWDPSLAVSGSVVHCTFQEDVNGGDYEIFYMRSTNSGITWETPVRLSNNSASSIYPNIAVSGQDVHVVWRDERDGQPEIYYRKSANAGATWQGLFELRLTNSAGVSEFPTICASPGTVHLTWQDNRVGNFEIFYKRFLNALPGNVYYDRLFYLCKAWGYAKYHHSEIASGDINWDDELFKAIKGAKNSISNQGFNDSLQMILENAGEMAISNDTLPYVPDSLNFNDDFSWIQNELFTDTVRALLDTIRSRFRPQDNVYVHCNGSSVNVEMDQLYSQESYYPSEEKRLLALFRYWNIINYFYPYKNLMDQEWDTTLVQFIPKIIQADDSISYAACFKELTAKINDSHGYLYGLSYFNWNGSYFPPFMVEYVENEMVVTRVLQGNPDIEVGDVIRAIDGLDVYQQRDSLRMYAHGSNGPVIERELNYMILWGRQGTSQVVLDDGNILDTVSFSRNSSNFNEFWTDDSPMWTDTIINEQCHFGIVNMNNLEPSWVGDMFYELWETDAIIFDIRKGANNTILNIVNYIYSNEIEIAKYTTPDCTYPGTYNWKSDYIGGGIPEPYDGNIIILFNEHTQSHLEWTCMGFEAFPGLIKIGSQTSGADGNISIINLPGYLSTWFTGIGVFYPDYTQTQRTGIIPDFEVHPTIEGVRKGIDEVLAFAMDCTLLDAKEITFDKEFKLYPNPFKDWLNYEMPGSEESKLILIEVMDVYGRTVAQSVKNSPRGELDFSDLPTGSYIVKITTNNEVLVKKVIRY